MKPKRFFKLFILCFGALFLLIAFTLVKGITTPVAKPSVEVARIYQPAPTPGSDLQSLEADAGIKIPSNAREIYAMISGFRDLVTYVRFDIPYADLSSFIQNTHCKEPLTNAEPVKYSPEEADPDWWEPEKAREMQKCSGEEDDLSQQILVDSSKPDKLTIYILSITNSSNKKSKP